MEIVSAECGRHGLARAPGPTLRLRLAQCCDGDGPGTIMMPVTAGAVTVGHRGPGTGGSGRAAGAPAPGRTGLG